VDEHLHAARARAPLPAGVGAAPNPVAGRHLVVARARPPSEVRANRSVSLGCRSARPGAGQAPRAAATSQAAVRARGHRGATRPVRASR
jgi:hypothetical protein